jgi:hypothetical protein
LPGPGGHDGMAFLERPSAAGTVAGTRTRSFGINGGTVTLIARFQVDGYEPRRDAFFEIDLA